MFEKRDFVVETIRAFLQLELNDKKNIDRTVDESISHDYQLLLPRQSNSHDCGLYTLSYIESLLLKPSQIHDLHIIENRIKLN